MIFFLHKTSQDIPRTYNEVFTYCILKLFLLLVVSLKIGLQDRNEHWQLLLFYTKENSGNSYLSEVGIEEYFILSWKQVQNYLPNCLRFYRETLYQIFFFVASGDI